MQLLSILVLSLVLSLALCQVPGKGDRCTLPDNCPKPLSCVGNPDNLRCFKKKPVLMRCGKDPFWVCRGKLECIDGICKRPRKAGGSCDDPRFGCPPPLKCQGNPGARFCFMPKPKGAMCGDDPEWLCEDSLVCHGGVCKCPAGRAEKCTDPLVHCTPPLSCVGPHDKRRCYMKKGKGMKCGKDPFWVCEDGLVCVGATATRAGRCRDP